MHADDKAKSNKQTQVLTHKQKDDPLQLLTPKLKTHIFAGPDGLGVSAGPNLGCCCKSHGLFRLRAEGAGCFKTSPRQIEGLLKLSS